MAPTRPTLVVCGSLNPAATDQVEALRVRLEVPVLTLADTGTRAETENRLASLLAREPITVLLSERLQKAVRPSISKSESIAQRVAETVKKVDRRVTIKTLFLIGGRTAYHVCRQLEITGFEMELLLAPNLPLCASLEPPKRLLVFKPGGFGDSNILVRSVTSLVYP